MPENFYVRVSICVLHLRSFTSICGLISSFLIFKTASKFNPKTEMEPRIRLRQGYDGQVARMDTD